MRIRIDHNVRELRRALRRAPADVMRETDRAMGLGALEIMHRARELAPKASSLLTNTIITNRVAMGDHLVAALAGYAGPVERGRKPGGPMPPLQDLIDWIRKVKIKPEGQGVKDERDLAFVIGRKIARDGTEEQPFMRPALLGHQSRLQALMVEGALAGARRAFA